MADGLDEDPGEGPGGSGHLGDREGPGRLQVRGDGGTGVEAEPAHPEQARAQQGEGQVVGGHGGLGVAVAGAQEEGQGQAGHARGDVHYGASGEVDGPLGAQVEEVAVRGPDPVAERAVDEEHPERDEGQPAPEGDALGHGSGDEGGRDDRELALEHGEGVFGYARGQDRVVDAPQQDETLAPADEAPQGVGAEAEAVAHHGPEHAHHGHGGVGVHHGSQHVLGAHQAAVEEGETGHHEQHQGSGGEHPGGTARIHDGATTLGQ